MDNPVAAGHPEWLVRDRKGEVLQYFGCHPVFDINNPEYLKHYLAVLDNAAANGMRHIYFDMGGTQPGIVNYAGVDKKTQLDKCIEIYKFLRDKGISVSIEGMSPLVVDEFWFRKSVYVNHTGKEFAFVGMSPSAGIPDHLAMDYFRLAMFYAFIDVNVAPYACGMETVPGEMALMEEIGKMNPALCRAIDKFGVPFVREEAFGSSWRWKGGAALFFWNPVDRLYLDMPPGWHVENAVGVRGAAPVVDGAAIRGVTHKSIIFLSE